MTRSNSSLTRHTLSTEDAVRQNEFELAVLDGLRGADRFLRQNAHHVGRIDVSATVALRVLDFLDEHEDVARVRQALFDLIDQRSSDLEVA